MTDLDAWLAGTKRGCVAYGSDGWGEPSACAEWAAGAERRGLHTTYIEVAQRTGTLLEHDILAALEAALSGSDPAPMDTQALRYAARVALNDGIEEGPNVLLVVDGVDGCTDWPAHDGVRVLAEAGPTVRVLIALTGSQADANRWAESLGGDAEIVAIEGSPSVPRKTLVEDLRFGLQGEPAMRAALAAVAAAFGPVDELTIVKVTKLDRETWARSREHPIVRRLLLQGAGATCSFASEAMRRAWLTLSEDAAVWDARFVEAAGGQSHYLQAYALAHALRARAGFPTIAALCTPARLAPTALGDRENALSHAFAELSRVHHAAGERFMANGPDRRDAWRTLLRSSFGIGAVRGFRDQLHDARSTSQAALRRALGALGQAARDPQRASAIVGEVDGEKKEQPSGPESPAATMTARERSQVLLLAFDRDEVLDVRELMAGLDLDDLRRVMEAYLPAATEPAATRLAALGQSDEALALALGMGPGPDRCKTLLRVALATDGDTRDIAGRQARAAFAKLDSDARIGVMYALPDGMASVFGPEEAIAIAARFPAPLGQYARIISLSLLARKVPSPFAEKATGLAMAAYRLDPDDELLDHVIACAPWMATTDAIWLLARTLGRSGSNGGLAAILGAWGGVEHLAPVIARVGGDELLLLTASEATTALDWLGPEESPPTPDP